MKIVLFLHFLVNELDREIGLYVNVKKIMSPSKKEIHDARLSVSVCLSVLFPALLSSLYKTANLCDLGPSRVLIKLYTAHLFVLPTITTFTALIGAMGFQTEKKMQSSHQIDGVKMKKEVLQI